MLHFHSFRFYIAQEIDMPFGEDSNDLPVEVLQHEFNESLLHLSTSLVANPGLKGLEWIDMGCDWMVSIEFSQVAILHFAGFREFHRGEAHYLYEHDS